MREMVRYGIILAVICAVASTCLALLHTITAPRILAQSTAQEEAARQEVMPLAATFEPVVVGQGVQYYKACAKDGSFSGVVFTVAAKGYSSVIETMVGMYKDGTIAAIKVLNQNETPGLGTQVAEEGFTSQFRQCSDIGKVQAITGATISSGAVIASVQERVAELMPLLVNEK